MVRDPVGAEQGHRAGYCSGPPGDPRADGGAPGRPARGGRWRGPVQQQDGGEEEEEKEEEEVAQNFLLYLLPAHGREPG